MAVAGLQYNPASHHPIIGASGRPPQLRGKRKGLNRVVRAIAETRRGNARQGSKEVRGDKARGDKARGAE